MLSDVWKARQKMLEIPGLNKREQTDKIKIKIYLIFMTDPIRDLERGRWVQVKYI